MDKNLNSESGYGRESAVPNSDVIREEFLALQESEKVLRTMLSRMSHLSTIQELPFENRLEAMRTSIKDGLPTLQLIPLFEEINRYLDRIGQQQESPRAVESDQGILQASQKLLEMMDAINGPTSLVENIEPAKALLHMDVDKKANNYFLIAMESFFDVLNHLHQELFSENRELQKFLYEMTEELQGIKQSIQIADEPDQFNSAEQEIKTSFEKLDDALVEKPELSRLTTHIRKCMGSINDSISAFKNSQIERSEQAKGLITRLKQRIEKLEQQVNQLKSKLVEKVRQYQTDSLTAIPNRAAYEDRIQQECERSIRNDTPVCLLICDVDNFKFINDTYGHAAGDKVLRQIAEVLKQSIRSVDFVARFGGEEFVIVINGSALEGGMKLAEKLRTKIEMTSFVVKNVRVPVTFSGGIAEFREYDSPASLFERADNALYIAKECGKNRIESE